MKKNENKNEFGIHAERKLDEEIMRDALRLEESIRIYMTGSKKTVVQADMGQEMGQNAGEMDKFLNRPWLLFAPFSCQLPPRPDCRHVSVGKPACR